MKYININVTPASFDRAVCKVQDALSRKGDAEITLCFAGGNYRLDKAIVLDAAQSLGDKRIRMLGGGRIKSVFCALDTIPTNKFERVQGKPYYVCQLKKMADGRYPGLRTLYVNGKMAKISRTREYRVSSPFERNGAVWAPSQANLETEYAHRLYVPIEAVEEAGVPNCAGAELHLRVEWEYKIYHIDHIDTNDTYVDAQGNRYVAMQLSREEKICGNPILDVHSRAFFICNTTSVLTSPGQYAYEGGEGKLYYYPEGDISDCAFGYGKQTSLFTFKNFASVTLRGLIFTGVEDEILSVTGYYAPYQAGAWWGVFPEIFPHAGAVKVYNVQEMDVDACRFADLPCDGISMVGVLDNVTVRNSRFERIGASAIRVGRPKEYSEIDQINNLRIENNFIDHIGFTYENCCSVMVTKARGARIAHNTILHSSYTAISLGWKWDVGTWEYGEQVNLENVEVAYNYIKSFLMNMRDGGGIYTLGGNVKVDYAPVINTLHDNVVIEDELTCPENGFFGSLYHDGASSNWHTYSNIVVHNPARTGSHPHYSARIYLQAAPAFVGSTEGQAAWHILCENNYICGCKNYGEVFRSQGYDPEQASDMLDYTRDLKEKDTHLLRSPKELKNYPDAVRILQNSGCDASIGKKK